MQHLQIAIVLVWRDDKILVQRRMKNATHLPNAWEFPGGKVEVGETPREAAVREAREELGVEIGVVSERETMDFEYPNRAVTLFPFDARVIHGEPQALASSELRWMFSHEMNADDFPAANASLIAQLQKV